MVIRHRGKGRMLVCLRDLRGKSGAMNEARDAARKGLDAALAAIKHTGWWLQWHTDRHACREATALGLLQPPAAPAERPAA
jgi:hypothetical protein